MGTALRRDFGSTQESARSVAEGLAFGRGDGTGGDLVVEVTRESGLGAGDEGGAFFLGAEAFGGALAGAGDRLFGAGDGALDGDGDARLAEVGGEAALLGFGEDAQGEGYGFGRVGKGRGAGVEGDDGSRNDVAGVVRVRIRVERLKG